jgi:hypothetical protein
MLDIYNIQHCSLTVLSVFGPAVSHVIQSETRVPRPSPLPLSFADHYAYP